MTPERRTELRRKLERANRHDVILETEALDSLEVAERDRDLRAKDAGAYRDSARWERERAERAEAAVSLSEDLRKHPMGSNAEQKWRADERAAIVALIRREAEHRDETTAYGAEMARLADRIAERGAEPETWPCGAEKWMGTMMRVLDPFTGEPLFPSHEGCPKCKPVDVRKVPPGARCTCERVVGEGHAMECLAEHEAVGRRGGGGVMGHVCETCQDTHIMQSTEWRPADWPCMDCPVPCRSCAAHAGRGAFCKTTPCECVCHAQSAPVTVAELVEALADVFDVDEDRIGPERRARIVALIARARGAK